ncbi:autotransporter domain-containing protein [Altererythrobacter salegens]|uniref:Autotransporter domain-containing protein n=1 Tax=Croceibacterium salegens TaxID=1737568 RepID=A0A6I4T0Q2_9SPHN|nr:autotransporter outer membrane beta-barrel domain-containing protein [Croceibacterium salegens]MXO61179.1 autotransporter domain-containing protein [Croceibacterium salegens]
MLRYLLASTAVLAIAAPAAAETISTKVTAPLKTSTVKAGQPDSITVATAGSVVLSAGTAITMDDDHSVNVQGDLTVTGANGGAGIVAVAGTTGDITNSGKITVDEAYTATDSDNDGDLDGPFAVGSNRYGIRTEGAHTGKVVNSGTIAIEGNDSHGILLGGPLTGEFKHDGKTTVLGDRSVGVEAGAISGNVRLAGQVQATGKDAVGTRFTGDIDGALVVQGGIVSTGYRYTTVPASTSKLDADDLLQGGSALMIEGDVAGGIVLAIPPTDSNPNSTDDDGDGIEDSKEGSAQITTYGAAPAMVVGASGRDIAIGPVAGTATQFGLQADGGIAGLGLYSGVEANGLQVGGRGGGVTIAKGIGISGTVVATSIGASATALRLGAGASTPVLQVSGKVEASGGNSATAYTTAVQIDAGANLPTLRNSGSIKATAGTAGTATAILDKSGGLVLIENSGAITAVGPATDSGRLVAIDLSANTSGATVRQTEVGTGHTAPSMTGDIRFGSGNDKLEVLDGNFNGNVLFGGGNNTLSLAGDAVQAGKVGFGAGNDTMTLTGTSAYSGTIDFGGGDDLLTLAGSSKLSGKLINSGGLALNVTGGALGLTGPVTLKSLTVGSAGILDVTLDKAAGAGTFYDVTGTASFAANATLSLHIADLTDAVGRYTILQAGTLQGAAGIKTTTDLIPFMFKATVATNAPADTLAIDVAKKTTTELGLNQSQSTAYNAVFAAIGADDQIEKIFLGITDGKVFRNSVSQMLPDHADGAFEGVSLGSRSFIAQAFEPVGPKYSFGGLDILFTAVGWATDKDQGATAAYNLDGFGFGASAEIDTGFGSIGGSLDWFWNEYDNGSDQNRVLSNNYELAAYWRGQWGGFAAFARGSYGFVDFRGRRTFSGDIGTQHVTRNVISKWSGNIVTASGGVSYEGGTRHFFFRPTVTADYLKLDEDGYTDKDGGGLNLIVDGRKSDEFAVNGGLALGIDFTGNSRRDENWFRIETEGGWRELVGGTLGSTTAKFTGGTPFTLDPEQRDSGWYARLRARGGTSEFELNGEMGVEDNSGNTAFTLRGTLRMRL